jgi:hypothetical protein
MSITTQIRDAILHRLEVGDRVKSVSPGATTSGSSRVHRRWTSLLIVNSPSSLRRKGLKLVSWCAQSTELESDADPQPAQKSIAHI